MAFLPIEDQLKIIKRGVIELLPEDEFIAKLKRSVNDNKPLNIKMGFDPTAPDIHLGHTVGIRKLRQFQDCGHHVTVIIGDYTATVGDPSDKKTTRPRLSHENVLKNAETYKRQILKILKADHTSFRYNGEWFSKMTFNDVMHLASLCTVAQMLERNDFNQRYTSQQAISLHEFFYPLMQAYDSVMIHADLEMGATEQKFNLIMGRNLQEAFEQEKQCVLTLPVLEGIDGKQRMSKSIGNYIGIDEKASEIYGKTLSIPDELIYKYFELLSDIPEGELLTISDFVKNDPRNAKRALARKLVAMYHDEASALQAEAEFDTIFIKKDIPDTIESIQLSVSTAKWVDFLTDIQMASSKSEARRLIQGGGISYNGEKIVDPNSVITLVNEAVLKVGKKKFLKTILI